MEQLIDNQWIAWIIVIVGLWTLPWKGVALWRSAQRKEKWWFVALFVVNTAGLLEILYIFVFSKKKNVKTQSEK